MGKMKKQPKLKLKNEVVLNRAAIKKLHDVIIFLERYTSDDPCGENNDADKAFWTIWNVIQEFGIQNQSQLWEITHPEIFNRSDKKRGMK